MCVVSLTSTSAMNELNVGPIINKIKLLARLNGIPFVSTKSNKSSQFKDYYFCFLL